MADKKEILLQIKADMQDSLARLTELSEELRRLKAQEKELKDEMKAAVRDGFDSQGRSVKELTALLVQNSEQQKTLRNELNAESRQLQNSITATGKYSNTLKGLAAQLATQKKILREIEMGEGKLSEAYQKQSKVVADLNAEVTRLESSYGDHQRNVGNYQSALEGLQGKLGKLKAGLVAVFAVLAAGYKFLKEFFSTLREQTQSFGDWFKFELAGMKSAYQELVAMMVSGEGWGQLIANLRTAYENGKKFAAMLDEIFERNNSLKIQEAEYSEEIEKNRIAARNTALSNEERLAAAEAVIRKEAELARLRRDIAQQELEANKGILQQKTKMTDADVEYYINNYNRNRQAIKEAQDFIAYERDMTGKIEAESVVRNYASRQQLEAELEQRRQALSTEAQGVVAMTKKYALSNDELVSRYVESYATLQRVNADYEKANARTLLQRDRMLKEIAGGEEKAAAATAAAMTKEAEQAAAATSAAMRKEAEQAAKEQEQIVRSYVTTVNAIMAQIIQVDATTQAINQVKAEYAELERSIRDQVQAGNMTLEEAVYYRAALAQREAEDIRAIRKEAADKAAAEEKAAYQRAAQERATQMENDLKVAWDNADERYRIRKDYLERELAMEGLAAERKAELEQQLTELIRQHTEERMEMMTGYTEKAGQIMSEFGNVMSNLGQRRVQEYESENEAQTADLDKRLKAGIISQKQYDSKVAALDKDLAKKKAQLEREQAIRERASSLFSVAINTARAIMKVWSEVPVAAAPAMTAVVGAMGAMQTANILSQPLPKARRGGTVTGASHEQGGVLIEAEGGERIVAAQPARAFPELLNLISYVGKHSAVPETGYALRNGAGGEAIDYDRLAEAMSRQQIWLSLAELRDAERRQAHIESLARQ